MNESIKDKLLIELERSFIEWKNAEGFKASLEQLNEIFFIEDYILASGFVSPKINRMICGRIRDTFNSWITQVHAWLIPTPYSIISTSENQLFNDNERKELNLILKDFMSLVSLNVVVGLTKDLNREAEYVDNSLILWKKHLPTLIELSKKVQKNWQSSKKKET